MSVSITGIGLATPAHFLEQREAARIAEPRCVETVQSKARLRAFFLRSGVESRRLVVVEGRNGHGPETPFFRDRADASDRGPTTGERMRRYEQDAATLATAAAEGALADSGWRATSITHLVTVSCSGFSAPGVDLTLMRRFGLRPTVERTHVGFMGCHGALNGLRVAKAIVEADPEARPLLVSVELCSLHFQYDSDPGKLVANALFSDGAAAVTCAATSEAGRWSVVSTGSCIVPDSADAMRWRIGDHGFEMTLAPSVPELIERRLRPWLSEWLGASGLRIDDIESWAAHPGGPKVLSAVEQALSLSSGSTADSRAVLAELGNMSSATVLFIFDRIRRRVQESSTTGPLVMLAFGPGLACEAALLKRD
ncbi:MAG: type III polyketide synthase [Phycisphaerales bacterium]